MDEPLRKRLLSLTAEDARVRAALAATGELYRGYAPRMAEVHDRNAAELDEILERHGWPGRSLVGDDGVAAAWLVVQHAIGQPALQRRVLPLLRAATADGEAPAAHAAYLEDRICFYEERPQRYGTQLTWDDAGQLVPWRLGEPPRVDELRRSVGLGTLAARLAEARRETADEPRPGDVAAWRAAARAWARSVGW